MPRLPLDEILAELGAEPLDGSGFESEAAEAVDEIPSPDPEVAE